MANSAHGIRITDKNGDIHEIPSFNEVQAGLNLRQKTLTAGANIQISGSTISATVPAGVDPILIGKLKVGDTKMSVPGNISINASRAVTMSNGYRILVIPAYPMRVSNEGYMACFGTGATITGGWSGTIQPLPGSSNTNAITVTSPGSGAIQFTLPAWYSLVARVVNGGLPTVYSYNYINNPNPLTENDYLLMTMGGDGVKLILGSGECITADQSMIRNSTIKPAYLDYQLLQGNGDPTGGYAAVIAPGTGYYANIPALPSASGTGDYRPSHYFALYEPNMLKVMLIGFMTCPGEPRMFTLITTRPNTSSNWAADTWREMLTPSSSKISGMDNSISNHATSISSIFSTLSGGSGTTGGTPGTGVTSWSSSFTYRSGVTSLTASFATTAQVNSGSVIYTLGNNSYQRPKGTVYITLGRTGGSTDFFPGYINTSGQIIAYSRNLPKDISYYFSATYVSA